MIIVKKGADDAAYINCKINKNTLTLGGVLSFDLSAYECDDDVHLDFSHNYSGNLIMGVSRMYVAQVDIPKRQYAQVIGSADEEGSIQQEREPIAFDPERVTVTLWPLEV